MFFKENGKIVEFDIDVELQQEFEAKQMDTASRFLRFKLFYNSAEIPLNQGYSFVFYAIKPDGTEIFNDCEVIDGYVVVELTNQTLAVEGTLHCELLITNGEFIITSKQFKLNVSKSINNTNAIKSTNEYTFLIELIKDVEEATKRIGEIGKINNTLLNNIQVGSITKNTLLEVIDDATAAGAALDVKISEGTAKVNEINSTADTAIKSIDDKVAEAESETTQMKELIDIKIEQANVTKNELQEKIDEAHGDFSKGLEIPSLLFKQDGKNYFPKFELTEKGLMIYADNNNKSENYLLIPFDGTIKWNDNNLYHAENLKPDVIRFGNSAAGIAGIGYNSTDNYLFISNDSNNWLRLWDDGSITWKGKSIHYADQAIYVNEIYSKGNSSNNFHIVNNGATESAGSTFIRAGVDLRIKDKSSNSYAPVLASAFTVSSEEKWKENVEELTESATEIINGATIFKYNLNGEENKSMGLIVDRDAPSEIITEVVNEDGSVDKLIDLYGMAALSWKSLQEQHSEITYTEEDMSAVVLELAQKDSVIASQAALINQLENDIADLMLEICS